MRMFLMEDLYETSIEGSMMRFIWGFVMRLFLKVPG